MRHLCMGTLLFALIATVPLGAADDEEIVETIMKRLEERLAEQNAEIRREMEALLNQLLADRDAASAAEEPQEARGDEGPESEGPENEVWSFLAERHDKDGDGKITAAEYDRGEAQYTRLDRNEDGTITVADFERGGRGMGGMRRQMRSMYMDSERMAPRILHRYFQATAGAGEDALTKAAFEKALAAYDVNGNETVERNEFEKESQERGARPIEGVGEYDRYRHLLAVADGDENETLSFDELLGFFASKDADGDLQLAGAEVGRSMGGRGGRGRMNDPTTWSGPPEGEMAPDFQLARTGSGGFGNVTLSSFRGNKPVALIFGSYT